MKLLKRVTAGLILSSSIVFGQNIASVNGEKISDRDLLPIIAQITQGRYDTLDAQTQQRVQNMALEQAIARVLLEGEAKRGGILKDKEFNEQLELAIKNLKRQLIADMWLKMELDKQSISIYEMREFYKNNKSEFVKPKQVHARHILLKTDAEANYVIRTLSKYSGERLQQEFIESAKKLSTGPSGPRGGDLGFFGEGVMVPEFNDAVFSMSVGEISKAPVKTSFGYHVIYLEEKKDSETATFEEAKDVIEQRLRVEKFQKFVENKISYLKSKAKIDIY
jgi:peptidyl-prolyl cis-trans isomerase C